MEELLSYEATSGIAVLTLNRPHVRNVLSLPLLEKMGDLIDKLKRETSIKVLIITGAGEQAFCAGADLKERQSMSLSESMQFVQFIQDICNQVSLLPMPTIAAINGDAYGGGLELALACDIRLAAEKARMGLTECSLGIIPGAGGTQRLPRIVGIGRAFELIFLAKRIVAAEAHAMGLVNAVAKDKDLILLAYEWAEHISKNAPLAIRAAKKAMLSSYTLALEEGLQAEFEAYQEIIGTKDRQEGLNAFMEKRTPRYEGA